jgi:hypothetical protein
MVTELHPFLRDAVFEPDEVRALARAFDDICREMDLPATAMVAREVVAMRVIDLAREGLIDPAGLKDRVLHEVHIALQISVDGEPDRPQFFT